MDLSDAALRERADAISRKCGTWDAVPSEAAMRFVADECCAAFIALRGAARAEQREASAGLIYDLAHSMAERGLFVRDDFGEPTILAIRELEAALAGIMQFSDPTGIAAAIRGRR